MNRPMGVPLVFSSREGVQRSGEKFRGQCPTCGTARDFYAAKKTFNVNLFLAISLWDSAEDVVQCGECLSTFEPASVPQLPKETKASLTERVTQVLGIGDEKPAPTASSGIPKPSRATKEPSRSVDAEIDAELAAMKKRLGK